MQTKKYAKLEDYILSTVQERIKDTAGSDSELINKSVEEIRNYLKTYSSAFDLHLGTIKDIAKKLKIEKWWNSVDKFFRIKESAVFARIIANESELLRFLNSKIPTAKHHWISKYKKFKDFAQMAFESIFENPFEDEIIESLKEYLRSKGENYTTQDLDLRPRRYSNDESKRRSENVRKKLNKYPFLIILWKLSTRYSKFGDVEVLKEDVKKEERKEVDRLRNLLNYMDRKLELWRQEGYEVDELTIDREEVSNLLEVKRVINDAIDEYEEKKIAAALEEW